MNCRDTEFRGQTMAISVLPEPRGSQSPVRLILHCNLRRASSVRGASRRRVADDDPLLEINHGLRDAGGVVGQPFEV